VKKTTWVWSIVHDPKADGDGFFIDLGQHSILDEAISWLGGELIRHGLTYRLGNSLIIRYDSKCESLMSLPITKEQAKQLGWDYFPDEDD
jgi:hypothetical protein